MSVRTLLLLVCLLFPGISLGQGFAGLGQGGEGFAMPRPDRSFAFPSDHGAHPDYRIEWWYLTATLRDADGTRYGIQWTLFRSALSPQGPQVWMGHLGLTTPNAHYSAEKLARGGVGQAGVQAAPFAAWIDDWELSGPNLSELAVRASTQQAGYDLSLRAQGPLVFHGEDGYSVKSESGQASYYYSQPFYDVSGTLTLPTGPVVVSGRGWLDREWSSEPLDADQEGWDWFSLHLENGAKLMGFQLRGPRPYTYASWVAADGTVVPYTGNVLRLTPLAVTQVAGRDIPTGWRLELPPQGVDIEVQAVNPQSWQDTLFPYWEGPVNAEGSHRAEGYLEMTGYE